MSFLANVKYLLRNSYIIFKIVKSLEIWEEGKDLGIRFPGGAEIIATKEGRFIIKASEDLELIGTRVLINCDRKEMERKSWQQEENENYLSIAKQQEKVAPAASK